VFSALTVNDIGVLTVDKQGRRFHDFTLPVQATRRTTGRAMIRAEVPQKHRGVSKTLLTPTFFSPSDAMRVPRELWRHVLSFSDERDLLDTVPLVDKSWKLLVQELLSGRYLQSDPDGGDLTSTGVVVGSIVEDSVHRCPHFRRRRTFVYGSKNPVTDEVYGVTLCLCDFCYSFAIDTFFNHHGALPFLRYHGKTVAYYVVGLCTSLQTQRQWLLDRVRPRVQHLLPKEYNCTFYLDPASSGVRLSYETVVLPYRQRLACSGACSVEAGAGR